MVNEASTPDEPDADDGREFTVVSAPEERWGSDLTHSAVTTRNGTVCTTANSPAPLTPLEDQ